MLRGQHMLYFYTNCKNYICDFVTKEFSAAQTPTMAIAVTLGFPAVTVLVVTQPSPPPYLETFFSTHF
jgi:hypothetical protein